MMYKELYQYLIQYRQLTLPGIGTFLIERKSAEGDFASRIIHSPVYSVALQPRVDSPSKKIFDWLSFVLNISDREAVIRLNDFAFDLKQKILSGDIIKWNGLGTLSKDSGGHIKFDPSINNLFEQPVIARKVIRKNEEHAVLVGEQEKTSTQMTELLTHHVGKKVFRLYYAFVLILLAIIFILWYFSEHGFNITSTGNNKKLDSKEAIVTHKIPQ